VGTPLILSKKYDKVVEDLPGWIKRAKKIDIENAVQLLPIGKTFSDHTFSVPCINL
jgi:hypothetical protein